MFRLLNTVSQKDVEEVGAKAANLGELCSLNLNVPKGFVVPTTERERFFSRVLEKLQSGTSDSIKVNESLLADIYAAFSETSLSASMVDSLYTSYEELELNLVSVRSSGTLEDSKKFSFAGIFETYLSINKDRLADAVKKCWSSVFSRRARDYILKNDINIREVGMGVLIQEMIVPDVSGVCFTSNPITGSNSEYYIEAAWGLGDAIVSGRITPDSYVFDLSTGSIVEKSINQQETMSVITGEFIKDIDVNEKSKGLQKLHDHVIEELVNGCAKIQEHFTFPQDIEFAVKDGVIYFLQARPITTL